MKSSPLLTVAGRELKDTLRDRRTLITMLVLPVILYPALLLGFGKLTASRTRDLNRTPVRVLVRLDGQSFSPADRVAGDVAVALAALPAIEWETRTRFDDEPAAVREGEVDLIVDLPSNLTAQLAEGTPVKIAPVYASARDASASAWKRVRAAIEGARDARFPLELAAAEGDVSNPEERGGQSFGGLLAMMVVFMAMAGAFYPAIDAAAGEKERGTLETLLLAPVGRATLVLGKYLAVLVVAVVSGLVNLASMSLTFTALPKSFGSAQTLSLPLQAVPVVILGLVLVSALFAAVCLALSTFARTYKEGQAYLTPALLVVMPLAMVGTLPNLQLSLSTALVPVANLCLLLKDLLSGRTPWREALVTLVVLASLTSAALAFSISLFRREDVLFRDGRSRARVLGSSSRRLAAVPAAALGLAYVGAFAAMFHIGSRLMGYGFIPATVGSLGSLLLVAALTVGISGTEFRSGLSLGLPSARAWGQAGSLGLLLPFVSAAVGHWQTWVGLESQDSTTVAGIEAVVRNASLPALFFATAIVPGLAEEIFFRGMFLRSLGAVCKPIYAIIGTAVAFGALHCDAVRFFPQFAAGLALGTLATTTRSVWPAVLAHTLHNALLLLGEMKPDALGSALLNPWAGGAAVALTVVLFAVPRWRR